MVSATLLLASRASLPFADFTDWNGVAEAEFYSNAAVGRAFNLLV